MRAWPELDLAEPCARAVGTVSVVVMPSTPTDRPTPDTDDLERVRRYLGVHKTVGTRVRVHAPSYTDIAVRCRIDVALGADPVRVTAAVEDAIASFLHPLHGGPTGRGWPFGRDVYRTELMAVAGAVPGVDLARSVDLALAGAEPEPCSNLCVRAVDLVALVELTVEVNDG